MHFTYYSLNATSKTVNPPFIFRATQRPFENGVFITMCRLRLNLSADFDLFSTKVDPSFVASRRDPLRQRGSLIPL